MKRMACMSCDAKLDGEAHFCVRCGEPTGYATHDERVRHDLETWRAHRDGVMASHHLPEARSRGGATETAARRPAAAEQAARSERSQRAHRVPRMPRVKLRVPRPRPQAQTSPTATSADDASDRYTYRSCSRCERSDWLIRTGKDEVGAWKYWCVRCSRAFTSELRLKHAVKPFAVSAAILLALVLLTTIH
jgi:hypothetical protein